METLSVATIRARFPAPRIPQLGGAYPGNYDGYGVGVVYLQLAGYSSRLKTRYKPMVLVAYKPINTIVLAGLIVMGMHFLQAG
jgi:hypothetical protein